MSESHSRNRIERTFYPSGQVETEIPFVGDHICGLARYWYENGVLQKEVPMTDSKVDGTVRQWDARGELLGECEIRNGTGIHLSWYDSGQLKGEVYERDGVANGRLRAWDEGGELLGEQFFISGRRVSKRNYQEACQRDLSLPRYDADDVQVPFSERCIEPPVEQSADDCEDARDALEWLNGSSEYAVRTLGELPTVEDSIALVHEFLDSGAVGVLAIHVETQDDDGSENAGQLLIELPSEPSPRRTILYFCNEQNRSCGYSAVKDTGQRFIQVALD